MAVRHPKPRPWRMVPFPPNAATSNLRPSAPSDPADSGMLPCRSLHYESSSSRLSLATSGVKPHVSRPGSGSLRITAVLLPSGQVSAAYYLTPSFGPH